MTFQGRSRRSAYSKHIVLHDDTRTLRSDGSFKSSVFITVDFFLFLSLSPQNLLFQAREDMFDKRTCILQPVLSINHSKMSLLGQAELGPSKNCFQQQKFTIIFNGPSDNYWPIYLHYLLKRLSFVLVRAWNEEVYAHEEIKTGKKKCVLAKKKKILKNWCDLRGIFARCFISRMLSFHSENQYSPLPLVSYPSRRTRLV